MQQRVEILKLLYRDARLLILDEPTAVLTPQEKDQLFAVLRGLRDQGRSIVLVTHKLAEDPGNCRPRHGDARRAVWWPRARRQTSEQELARLMVGRDVNLRAEIRFQSSAAGHLRIEGFHVRMNRARKKFVA